MAARRNGRAIHGWLVVDKPSGLTSAAVIGILRRLTGAAKAGHGGTLDPLATGVLPVAFGEATKTVGYAMAGAKDYLFTVRWGEGRNTDDCEGSVTAVSDVRPSAEAIAAVLPRFTGAIEQTPPAFSAVKVDGHRAYALARAADGVVSLQPRPAFIETITLVDCPDPDHASFRVRSGKGVYMRALARDIAVALGTLGHISALRRLGVGPFGEDQAVALATLRDLAAEDLLDRYLQPLGAAMPDVPAITLTETEARRLQHGQAIATLPVASRSHAQGLRRDAVVYATLLGRPVALAQIKGCEIRPLRVLNV